MKFQQDNATPHFENRAIQSLKEKIQWNGKK